MNTFTPPTLSWLQKHAKKIHFFGLGFIQIKITDTVRYHFYTRKLESIMPVEEVHNHRYDFTSQIMRGSLCQEVFHLYPPLLKRGEYKIWEVSCKPGEEDVEGQIEWVLSPLLDVTMHAGSEYKIAHNVFHRVSSDYCITRVERGEMKTERAAVLRKIGAKKVCPFSKQVPVDTLWEIVEDMLET